MARCVISMLHRNAFALNFVYSMHGEYPARNGTANTHTQTVHLWSHLRGEAFGVSLLTRCIVSHLTFYYYWILILKLLFGTMIQLRFTCNNRFALEKQFTDYCTINAKKNTMYKCKAVDFSPSVLVIGFSAFFLIALQFRLCFDQRFSAIASYDPRLSVALLAK